MCYDNLKYRVALFSTMHKFSMETIPGIQKLGVVRISSLNQVGENVKYDIRTKSLVLSRAGSTFDLLVHIDTKEGLFDFRDAPVLTVSFRLNNQYLSIDLETRKAVLAEPINRNEIPRSAIFQYQRRKFDRSSASVAYLYDNQELWLRHSNSKLRVCELVSVHVCIIPSSTPRVRVRVLAWMPHSCSVLYE